MNDNINKKQELGKKIYNICLVLTTVILVCALFIVKDEDADKLSCIRYSICFYSFVVLLGGGSIIREFLSGEYIKKKMIIKCAILTSALIIGTILIVLFTNPSICLATFFLGLGSYMFTAVPTVIKEEKNKNGDKL